MQSGMGLSKRGMRKSAFAGDHSRTHPFLMDAAKRTAFGMVCPGLTCQCQKPKTVTLESNEADTKNN